LDGQRIPAWVEKKSDLPSLGSLIVWYGVFRGVESISLVLRQLELSNSLFSWQVILNENSQTLMYYGASLVMALAIIYVGFRIKRQKVNAFFFTVGLFIFDGLFFHFGFDFPIHDSVCANKIKALMIIVIVLYAITAIKNHELIKREPNVIDE
jgi:hypothetical protein